MNLSPELVKQVGLYGGPAAVIFVIEAVVLLGFAHLDVPQDKRYDRFLRLAYTNALLALLAFGYLFFARRIAATPQQVISSTTNSTTGNLSPIMPGNCGSISITGKEAK